MKAGNDLDCLIAEKIFEWKLVSEEVESGMPHHELYRTPSGRGFYHYQVPKFSSEIDAAWRVVEKFRRGFEGKASAYIEVVVTDLPDYQDTYCKIVAPDRKEVVMWAHEAPLAICLAALKAVGVEVPE